MKKVAVISVAIVVGLALVAAFVVSDYGDGTTVSPADVGSTDDAGTSPKDLQLDLGHVDAGWGSPELVEDGLETLHEGVPVEANCVFGVAGTYPPTKSEGVAHRVPKTKMPLEMWCTDRVGHAMWAEVPSDTSTVELREAKTLDVRVVHGLGEPVEGADVRLALAEVALVVRKATTDDAGVASFEGVPAGTYVVGAEARGFRSSVRSIDASDTIVIALDRGREARGTVTLPTGDPAVAATVAVYDGRDLPGAIVATDARGNWSAERLAPGPTRAVAVAPGFPPASSPVVDTVLMSDPATLDVRLRPGRAVQVLVVDASGAPVRRARVSWRDPNSTAGGAVVVDDEGATTLRGLPADAVIEASIADWTSAPVELALVPMGEKVELILERFDATRRWRIRVETTGGVAIDTVAAHDAKGVRCAVERLKKTDFELSGCGPSRLSVVVETSAGIARFEIDAEDGASLQLPEPVEVAVTVVAPARTTVFGGTLSAGSAVVELQGEEPLRATVLPGDWQLVVDSSLGVREFPLDVRTGRTDHRVTIEPAPLLRLWATDEYNAPVTGARVFVFDDGRPFTTARTAGQLPNEISLPPTSNGGTVLVVDPRRGEAVATFGAEGLERRLVLDATVLGRSAPGRLGLEEVVAVLGAELVARDRGYQLQFVRRDAPGQRAGLRTGDWIVTAREAGSAAHVVVHRAGEGYVEVTVPRR